MQPARRRNKRALRSVEARMVCHNATLSCLGATAAPSEGGNVCSIAPKSSAAVAAGGARRAGAGGAGGRRSLSLRVHSEVGARGENALVRNSVCGCGAGASCTRPHPYSAAAAMVEDGINGARAFQHGDIFPQCARVLPRAILQ